MKSDLTANEAAAEGDGFAPMGNAAEQFVAHLKAIVDARAEIASFVESPIELILGSHLLVAGREHFPAWEFATPSQVEWKPADRLLFIPQFPWRNFRVDFALRPPSASQPNIVIECDGHEFHAATAAQIYRDGCRDDVMQAAGITVIRFTGSQINTDPRSCAEFVLRHLPPAREVTAA